MANKTFEDLAKNLGYTSFSDMKKTIGKSNRGMLSTLFSKESKKPSSPSRDTGDGDTINSDIIPFLNIIPKNSLALPGMARDMNVLRQNIVELVKQKNKESAITKADKAGKFFQTEDQREKDLEDARKKETSPTPLNKEGKPKKEKGDGGTEGVAEYLWDLLKKILGTLFLGLGLAFASAFDMGKLISTITEKLNPLPLIESLFDSIAEGWKQITETDIVKETLIKGVGKFLEFITAGLFGEKELRTALNDLGEFLTPMIDVITETFNNIVAWLKDNVGWDPFTIPLSKVSEFPGVKQILSTMGWTIPDIQVPGFRPFKDKKPVGEPKAAGGGAPPTAPAEEPKKEDLKKAQTAQGDVVYDENGNVISGSAPTGTTPTKQSTKKTQEGKVQRTPESVAKAAEKDKKSAVEFLKTQVGIVYDPNSPTMFSDLRSGNFVEEQSVRDRITDMKGNPDKILSLVKPTPTATPTTTPAAAATPPTGGATEGGAPPTGGGVTASPSAETAPAPSASGSEISSSSAQVAEGQRMDSAADAGTVIDAGTTNNNMSTSGKKPKQVADAYNTSFISNYYGKTATT